MMIETTSSSRRNVIRNTNTRATRSTPSWSRVPSLTPNTTCRSCAMTASSRRRLCHSQSPSEPTGQTSTAPSISANVTRTLSLSGTTPQRYIPKLIKFQGAIGLDYSTCVDFPRPLKEWNAYRNRVCDFKLQDSGVPTIPLLRGDPDTIEREVSGLEKGRAIAVSPRGCVKNPGNRRRFVRGLRLLVDKLEPSMVISYGPNSYGVLEYPIELGIPVHAYASRGRGDLGGGVLCEQVL